MRLQTSLLLLAAPFVAAATAQDTFEEKYEQMKALVSELVSGKPPTFTESVYSRLSSLYTQPTIIAQATDAAADTYSSLSSAAGAMMTPPPAIESYLLVASSQVRSSLI